MHVPHMLRRRPSPALVISSIALFISLGGAGYAATQLPDNSVGANQIRNEAVTYKKIRPGAVGNVRANVRQLQERVWKSCPNNKAISSIARNGDPTCQPTVPAEFGTTNNTASSVGATATPVTTVALPAGATYLAFANPTATVTPATGVTAAQHTTVTCTLTVGSNTQTRSVTIDTAGGAVEAASIPLQVAGQSGTGTVSCTSGTTPAPTGTPPAPAGPGVSVTAAINAIQTASNS